MIVYMTKQHKIRAITNLCMAIELATGVTALKEKDIKHLNDEWLDELQKILIEKAHTFLNEKFIRGLIGDIDKNEKSTLKESDEIVNSFIKNHPFDKELDDKLQTIPESNEISRLYNEIEGINRYKRR